MEQVKWSKRIGVLAGLLVISAPAVAGSDNPLTLSETWTELRGDIVGEAQITDGAALFEVNAPYRAHDAATVPVVIKQIDPTRPIRAVTVVVDENPAPVAAELSFSDAMAPIDFELRVRVNQYSNVRVLADTAEGWRMNGRYVKASGGCSAPATRAPDLARAAMGQMKLRMFSQPSGQNNARAEAQIMIRHPNYSGLQRDQITQLFVPAHFIHSLEVLQGDERLFTMSGGISISENPVFRFQYRDNGAPTLTVRATDTEGNVFVRELTKHSQS